MQGCCVATSYAERCIHLCQATVGVLWRFDMLVLAGLDMRYIGTHKAAANLLSTQLASGRAQQD